MSERKNDNRAQEAGRDLIAVSHLSDEQLFEKFRTEADGLNHVEPAGIWRKTAYTVLVQAMKTVYIRLNKKWI